jgi:hypothetical protein
LASGCSDPLKVAYRTSLECVGDEMAYHLFIDQEIREKEMMPAERERFAILRRRAERDAERADVPLPRLYNDVVVRYHARSRFLHTLDINTGAELAIHRSQYCLARAEAH